MFPQPEAEQSNEYIKSVGKPGNLHKKKSQIHRLCWQIFASFTTHDSVYDYLRVIWIQPKSWGFF